MNVSEYRIGSGSLSLDGSDVGGTTPEGIVVKDAPDVHLHLSGKFGSTPVKATLLGRKLTLEITMAETTAANMLKVFPGSVSADGKTKFGGVAGVALVGHTMVLTPFDGTTPWHFRNVVQTSPIDVAYQTTNERVFKATFTALIDMDVPEAENLAYVS